MPSPIFNRKEYRARRRILRNNATPQEVVLWKQLRNNRLGYKFRRQQGIGPYIVDFCCPQKNLIIELDGGQHGLESDKEYDARRTRYLESLGYTVLRFSDTDVNNKPGSVLDMIVHILNEV